MSVINDGGPAFPMTTQVWSDGGIGPHAYCQQGMSMRDWFAGRAMSALMALDSDGSLAHGADLMTQDDIAADAYRYADAMIRAREAGK